MRPSYPPGRGGLGAGQVLARRRLSDRAWNSKATDTAVTAKPTIRQTMPISIIWGPVSFAKLLVFGALVIIEVVIVVFLVLIASFVAGLLGGGEERAGHHRAVNYGAAQRRAG